MSRYPFYKYFDLFTIVKKSANAILTGRFIGKTVVEHRREFIEHFPYGKQIDDYLDIRNCQKRPQATKPILLGLEYEKSGNQIPFFENFENMKKMLTNSL